MTFTQVFVGFIIIMIIFLALTYLVLRINLKKEEEINKKYSSEKEYIEKQTKKLQELEENYHRKIKILKDFCGKDTLIKYYDKYKTYNLAEMLMQERDNLNDYKELFRNKLSKKEEEVLWEYIGNTYVDLKIEDYENIKLRYDFYKEDC